MRLLGHCSHSGFVLTLCCHYWWCNSSVLTHTFVQSRKKNFCGTTHKLPTQFYQSTLSFLDLQVQNSSKFIRIIMYGTIGYFAFPGHTMQVLVRYTITTNYIVQKLLHVIQIVIRRQVPNTYQFAVKKELVDQYKYLPLSQYVRQSVGRMDGRLL